MTSLSVVLEEENAIAIFAGDSMKETLHKIEEEVSSVVPDVSSVKGRKAIASLANKVAKSKVALDNAGKTLTADWKAKAKLVDVSRKEARDFLDALKEKVRMPLTEWEMEEKRKSLVAKIKAEIEEAHSDALAMNDLFNREAIIAEKERVAAEKEAKELQSKEEARIATEKIEHDRLLKEQAAEQAKLKAEREAQTKIDEAKRLEAEAIAREEKLKREAIEAENRARQEAEQAERDRLQAIEDSRVAQENAVREAQEQARRGAEKAENKRLADEAEVKKQAEIKSNNLQRRIKVNNEVLKIFVGAGVEEGDAKDLIKIILKSESKLITINY